MGVIRKKTATRGGEGGVKYVCDVCSADITSTVGCSSSCSLYRVSARPDAHYHP
jgi:transcriptional adapter 2-alpha